MHIQELMLRLNLHTSTQDDYQRCQIALETSKSEGKVDIHRARI